MTAIQFINAYNLKAEELMPHMASDLKVSLSDFNRKPSNSKEAASFIDEVVFSKGEYLGGMANVICAVVNQAK